MNRLIARVAESLTATLFGTGGEPRVQLRFDACGRSGASAGHTGEKLPAGRPVGVAFVDTAVASVGMLQFPFGPSTCCVNTSPGRRAVARSPTLSGSGRVSKRRHGPIGTNTARSPVM